MLALWSIHPFREGNTRTCIMFLWHYLKGKGVDFQVALLRNNPMYVRHALKGEVQEFEYFMSEEQAGEQYKIAKEDYEAFMEKYLIKKGQFRGYTHEGKMCLGT